MTRLTVIATAIGAAVLNYVQCASITTTTESASEEPVGDLEPRISASNPGLEIWNKNLLPSGQGGLSVGQYDWERRTKYEYNHTKEINTYSYQEGTLLTGWVIAVIVIVPLIVLIAIIVAGVCVYRACTRRKVYPSYAYQAGPPPYPVNH
ncbi:uncharacterized protein LOC119404992 [Rhipicephalus sanguineus]|uniref:uncharacterized protein LOC119404992 n=1 Tax=Rhipicephalus sanguineus TaxID=34632 RepID=UPI0018945641|nr:uncharacterized protein LOC119404992 [Rhipicephalus sanguineus]